MEEEQHGLVDIASSGLPQEGSLLDTLAEERAQVAAAQHVDIAIPGYNRVRLYARYRLLEGPELSSIGRKVGKEFRKNQYAQNLYGSIDVFVTACIGFYYQFGDDPELKPLTVEGVPVTGYNRDLARALRFDDKIDPQAEARSIVFGLFGNNEVAIQAHNLRLGRWFSDTSADVDSEFLEGNS